MGYKKVIITKHIQDRIRERFSSVYDAFKSDPVSEIKNLIDNGYVSRSFINNTKFMHYLEDTYGYGHTYDFIVNGDIVFVIKKNEGKRIAVTCLDKKKTTFIKQATSFKDKKKKKKVKKPVGIHSLEEIQEMNVDIDDLLADLRK